MPFKKGETPEGAKPFEPGKSGNPKGRPKLIDLSDLLFEEVGEDGFREATKALLRQAKKGNIKAIQELYDRYYGKVTQKTETDLTTGGQPFSIKDLIGFKE